MSFLYPWFLLALSAVIIPIIIHLFHFRRFKKVYFSNIKFLQKISDETQKQARLKHLLVLFSRILAIVFLVMAFARPFIPLNVSEPEKEGNKLSIYVDNSFSMEAGTDYGSLLDQAKQSAAQMADLFEPTDQYQLLTNDLEARHQRFVGPEEFMGLLSEVTFSPSVRNITEIIKRQTDLLNEDPGNEQKIAAILSDFQKNNTSLQGAEPDSLIDYLLIPFPSQRPSNLFIDSVWIENPVRLAGQAVTIEARVFNDSDQRLENQPIRLYVKDNQRSVATFNIAPYSHATASLTYTPGPESIQSGYLEITDHPVTFDDKFYFSFSLSEFIPVMAINQDSPNRFLGALLSTDTTFVFRNVQAGAIDFSLLGSQNLIILNGLTSIGSGLRTELNRYVSQGGHLLVFPAENADLPSYNEMLLSMGVSGLMAKDTQNTRVTAINDMHSIYKDVFEKLPENMDLPRVNQYFVIDRQTRGREQFLMQLQNGNSFFIETPSGQGKVYLSAVPANDSFSNFPRHAIFVPTLYNIALHSAAYYPLSYTIGHDEFVTIKNYRPGTGELFKISANQQEVIPETRTLSNNIQLMLHGQIDNHGNYQLFAGDELLRHLSFNYDRRESLLESYSTDELKSMTSEHDNINIFEAGNVSFEKQLELLKGGRQLWRFFLLLALFFLVAEVLLLRFMK